MIKGALMPMNRNYGYAGQAVLKQPEADGC